MRGIGDLINLDQAKIPHHPCHLVKGLVLHLIAIPDDMLLLIGFVDQRAIEGTLMS